MNNIKIFKNEEFGQVRIVTNNKEPWFVGKDVAEILGYSDTSDALKKHVDEEDKMGRQIADSLGRLQTTKIINESGLYSLILGSKLPNAKKFKKWVTSEILPSIRKTGMYATEELLDNPDLLIAAATKLKEEKEKNKQLEAEKKANAPKVLFAKAVETSKTSILVGELAKLIKQNGVDIGEKRLFRYLRQNEYLIKRKGVDYNMPTQKSLNLGLFEIKERTINNPDGSIRITKTPKVTGKGQQYFINKFLQP